MKSFAIKTLLFCLPVLVAIIGVEILLLNAENSYEYKHDYLTENQEDIQTLIFGSSYAYYGINPNHLSSDAFNLANASQSLYFHHILLKKHIVKLPKLETIIINIAYSSLSRKRSQETWRKYYYHHYMQAEVDLISKRSLGSYSIFGGIGLKPSMKMIWKSYLKGEKRNKGWQPLKVNQHQWGKKSAIKQENNSTDFTQNIALLNEMIELCEAKGVNVVLLTMPVYHTYSDNIDTEKLAKVFKACKGLEKANQNTYYLNHFFNNSFTLTDYFDEHHLSKEGASKMSILLNKELEMISPQKDKD